MAYTLENEVLRISVEGKGAELTQAVDKATGKQMMWTADPAVWQRHAPLLFPYCGGLHNKQMLVDGTAYPAAQHGFARDCAFSNVRTDEKTLVLRLAANDETRRFYPFDFVLEVAYTLTGRTVNQTVSVHNPATEKGRVLPFNVGFHPGFILPFTPGKKTSDYEIYFEQPESPIVIETPGGYVSGGTHRLFSEKQSLPLSDDMFAEDSICLSGLHSRFVMLREIKNPQRRIKVDTKGFPYVLLWGPSGGPLPFMCIEPWHGLPDGPDGYTDFADKPGITLLAPGERFETCLRMGFCV